MVSETQPARFHEARESGAEEVAVWGTGNARREFLHVDDMAAACLFVMNLDEETFRKELFAYPRPCFVNVGVGADVTIRELAQAVAAAVGFGGKLVFDAARLDGTPQKLLDVSRLSAMGWRAAIPLEVGLAETFAWFLKNGFRREV